MMQDRDRVATAPHSAALFPCLQGRRSAAARCAAALAAFLPAAIACAQEAAAPAATPADADWSLHAQFTNVTQAHPAFTSPYQGPNSLDHANGTNETADLTAFVGRRLWQGAGLYVDPEIDQGYGLSGTLGVAGFPSGEAYKLGYLHPYFRLPRAFVRQWLASDGAAPQAAAADAPNQLAGAVPDDGLVLTVGKFSVVDIFDTNRYAHDPRADFFNWSVIESGAFDYPADAWGFTYGAAAEWSRADRTLRGGFFALSKVPNTRDLDGEFKQYGVVFEFEQRYRLGEHAGKAKILAFDNRGRMGSYDAAVALGAQDDAVPSTALVRHFASRPGGALNLEQELATDLGAFLRLSANDGSKEAFDFTEINKSLATGLCLQGASWSRPDDAAGAAVVVNGLSSAAQAYFAAGGMGILIGDGHLSYGYERILETYYAARLSAHVTLSGDYQLVVDPAYNRDRGPVSIFALRLHLEF